MLQPCVDSAWVDDICMSELLYPCESLHRNSIQETIFSAAQTGKAVQGASYGLEIEIRGQSDVLLALDSLLFDETQC
jgi:hypothetical protein